MIGYLLMHTRRLDMMVPEPRQVRYYQDKMGAEIARVLDPSGGTTPPIPE